MNKIIALTGMPGSGKTEASWILQNIGFSRIRFGDLTEEVVRKKGMPLNEESERKVREELREKHGMAAFAILNVGKIDIAVQSSNVVIDGMYSYEELDFLKNKYKERLITVAIVASPETRYARLGNRDERGLDIEDAKKRDSTQKKHLNIVKTIKHCDYKINNEGTLEQLGEKLKLVLEENA